MHMVLTGATITAREAEAAGLVAFVYPDEKLVEEAVKTGTLHNSLQKEHSHKAIVKRRSPSHCQPLQPGRRNGKGSCQPRLVSRSSRCHPAIIPIHHLRSS